MVKTKLFKTACIILAACTICIIPANIMEASKKAATVKNVIAKGKSTTEKKENSLVINTSLTEEDQEKLFKQYKKYDIVEKDGILYYKNKKVRCFADIYSVRSQNKNGGVIRNSQSAYTYFNENGSVDICIEREDVNKGKEWAFGKIINKWDSFENLAFAMPVEVIDKLLEDSIKEGNYKDLESFIVFASKESINNAAKQMVSKGDYNMLETLAWNTSTNVLGEIAVQLVEKGQYGVLQNIACFINSKDLDKIAAMLCEKEEYDTFSNIVYALSKDTVNTYAWQFAREGREDVFCNIAWAASKDTLEKIAKEMADKREYNMLMITAPFLAE